jgi:hypothetical protein
MRPTVITGLLAALPLAAMLAAPATAAPYEFEFTIEDYAIETAPWTAIQFFGELENTGTMLDTVDIDVVPYLPAGWSASLCVNGKCVPPPIATELGPGEVAIIDVLVFVGGTADAGTVDLVGGSRIGWVVKTEILAAFDDVPSIMIVDDDAGASYESYMLDAVEAAGYKAHVWNADSLGRPGERTPDYWAVLWTTADGGAGYLTSSDEQDMMDHLDGGGNLLLASAGFLTSRGGQTTFTSDYLHLTSWIDDAGGTTMSGVAADPVSDGMSLDIGSGPFSSAATDRMTPDGGATTIFTEGGGATGLRVENDGHRLVFLAFPFENVSTTSPDPDNQDTLTARILDWFDPPVAGIEEPTGAIAGLQILNTSPNPFTSSTAIGFSLASGDRVRLDVYDVTGQMVTTLVEEHRSAGRHSAAWNGRDDGGRVVASGIYFCRLSGGLGADVEKVLLVR